MSTDPTRSDSPWGIDASTGPDELHTAPAIRASRFPRWALLLAGVLATLLAVGGAAYGAWRYNASKPQVVVTASSYRTPWKLVPPLTIGDYSRDANLEATPTPNPTTKGSSVAATYAKGGQNAFVLLLSRPETDGRKFMESVGMNTVVPTDDGWCGTSVDTNHSGCAVLRDNTAILVVDLAGASRQELMTQAHAVATQLSGQ